MLAANSNGVRAFVSTMGGRTSTTRDTFMMRETPGPAAPKRVMILPDSRAVLSDSDLWPHHLKVGKFAVVIQLFHVHSNDRTYGNARTGQVLK